MRLFLTLFFSAFLFIRLTAQKPDSSSVIYLTPEQFREELSILSNPLIIDVREFFEYRRSRLNDAINIPSSGSIEIPADTIDKSRHLFLYCTSGFRSKRVAEKFIEKGFKHVYSLDGGISEWRKKEYPVDRRRKKNKRS